MRSVWRWRALAVVAALAVVCGCKNSPTDAEGIRAGITQHLASLKTLNISAMDLDVNNISMQGDQAHVQVTFRPKTGAPPGAGMQVAYQMERRGSAWVVVKTEGVGGGIQHPDANGNPHVQSSQADAQGGVPNFRDLLPTTAPSAGGTLPPGHPSVDAATQPKTADPNAKPN